MRKGFNFNPDITMGNILQMVVIVGGLVSCYMALDHRLTVLETRLSVTEPAIRGTADALRELKESQKAILQLLVDKRITDISHRP